MKSHYECSVCKQLKPRQDFYEKTNYKEGLRSVSSDCRACRSDHYFRKHGVEPTGTCNRCKSPGFLSKNGQCRRCMRIQGLKQCKKCGEIESVFLGFYRKRAICKNCLKR